MKIRNEERQFTHVKTLTHQGYTFAFASSPTTRSGSGSEYDEVFWCVLDPTVGAKVKENVDVNDLTIDDGWTELIPLNCATETRVVGMNLLSQEILGEDADGNPNTTASLTQANPFVVVSDEDYIYLFRSTSLDPEFQASSEELFPVGLLVDRFVFQQEDIALAHATETRYVRSENADVPASDKDSLGSQSMDGDPFLEPAFLLPLDVQFSSDQAFSVVRVPIDDKSSVWHIFTPDKESLVAFSIPSSLLIPFDVSVLHGFNTFSSNNQTTYPLIVPSAKYKPAYEQGQLTISNISSTLYYQQEPAHSKDGDAISMMTNARILVNLTGNDNCFAVIDLELGLNGRLAGSSTEKWMDSNLETNELHLSEIPFYGTALELNGRSDYVTLPTISTENTDDDKGNTDDDKGMAFEAWIMPYADPQDDQCIIELEFDNERSRGIYLTKDLRLSLFGIPSPDDGIYLSILNEIPPLAPGVWAHISFVFSPSQGSLNGYLNGRRVGNYLLTSSSGQSAVVTVGRSKLKNKYFFKGTISEIRVWDNMEISKDHLLLPYQSIDVWNLPDHLPSPNNLPSADNTTIVTGDIISVYQMDEGKGNTLTNSVSGKQHENAINGGRWIRAASPSRISMPPVCERDNGLLGVRGAVLPDVQNIGAASLLPSADGLVRMAYRRKDDNHWGSLHYDTRTQRNQVMLSWQGSQDNKISARLRFTALSSGTSYNLCQVIIEKTQDGKLTISMYENGTETGYGLFEQWKDIPKKLSSIVDIINGRMPDTNKEKGALQNYDYKTNVTRTLNGNDLKEDQLPERLYPHASLLFGATGIHELDEDLDQSLPDDLSTIQYTYIAGSDPRWVLDPVPAAVKNPIFQFEDRAADKLQLDGDVTLEAWAISSDHLNGTNTILFQGYGNTPYVFGLTQDNHLYAVKNKGSDIVFAIGKDPIPDSMQWTHLAAAYRSSWGLHLHDEAYIRCSKLQREPGEAITIEAWVCPDTESINSGMVVPIISQWAPEMKDKRFILALDSGTPVFSIQDNNDNEYTVSGSKSLTTGAWTHLSGVYQAAETQNMLYFPESHNSYAAVLKNRGIPSTMTIEMWIRPGKKTGGHSTLISCGGKTTNSLFEMSIDSDGHFHLHYPITKNNKLHSYDTGVVIPLANDKSDDSYDTHLAVVFNWTDDQIAVYVNGRAQELNKQTTAPNYDLTKSLSAFGWILGAALDDPPKDDEDEKDLSTQKHYVGGMHEVRLWSTARTQQQVIDHLNVPVSTAEAGLRGYWKLDSPPNDTDFGEDFDVKPRITNALNAVSVEVQGDAYFYAAPIEASLELYVNTNNPVTTQFDQDEVPAELSDSDAALYIGKVDKKDSGILSAIVDDIRLWTTARLSAQIDYYKERPIDNPAEHVDLAAYWSFDKGKGQEVRDETGGNPGKIMGVRNIDKTDEDNPFWIPTPITSYWTLFVDGVKIGIDTDPENNPDHPDPSVGAWLGLPRGYSGYLAEVRVWDVRRKQRAIQSTLNHALRGDETGLVAYWPCNDNQGSGTDGKVGLSDRVINPCDALFSSSSPNIPSQVWALPGTDLPYPVPVADDVQYAINVSNGVKTKEAEALELSSPPAITELDAGAARVHIGVKSDTTTWLLDTDEEPDATDLVYLGQIQTGARIVGYIEGAPPLPSENLGIEQGSNPDKYMGTSSVTLEQGDEVRYSGVSQLSGGLTGSFEISFGIKSKFEEKLTTPFFEADVTEASMDTQLDLKGDADFKYRSVATARIVENKDVKSSLIVDGSFEQNLYNIGNFNKNESGVQPRRIYRPNNMGVAIVKSMVADFYAIRSKRTGATVGYLPVADPNIPPDTNVIMFKINPAYIKNGSLDGHIGFDKDIHYRSLGPSEKGSYYKVQEAYTTKGKIERQQAEYTNFFKSLTKTIPDIRKSKKDWISEIANRSMVNTYVWTADGGLSSEEMSQGSGRREAMGLDFDISGQIGLKIDGDALVGLGLLAGVTGSFNAFIGVKLEGIHTTSHGDTATFALASKVDGEGFLGKQAIPVQNVDVTGLDWGNRPQTPGDFSYLDPSTNALTKALIDAGVVTKIRVRYQPETYTTNYTIYEDKDGNCILEDVAGIFKVALDNDTDPTKVSFTPYVQTGQYPINYQAAPCPGKVLGYRFMSFYLDPDKKNFDALANTKRPDEQIIDQDWLNNLKDPNAVALKNALTRRNEVWRVFHRVTYVNRVPPDKSSENAEETKHVTLPNSTKRPDDISMARNSLLTPILLGYNPQITGSFPDIQHSGYPPNIQIIDKNIALLVESMSLPKLQAEKLANQLHKYMVSYIAPDQETDIFSLKIQAEDYSDADKHGVSTDKCDDIDGGYAVSLAPGATLDYYYISIPKSRTYKIEYHVSSPKDTDNGEKLMLSVNGTDENLDIPNTSNVQKWQTISHFVDLEEGVQNFQISSYSNGNQQGWNFNWWCIKEAD